MGCNFLYCIIVRDTIYIFSSLLFCMELSPVCTIFDRSNHFFAGVCRQFPGQLDKNYGNKMWKTLTKQLDSTGSRVLRLPTYDILHAVIISAMLHKVVYGIFSNCKHYFYHPAFSRSVQLQELSRCFTAQIHQFSES